MYALDPKIEGAAKAKRNWASIECMDVVRGLESIYDYWVIAMQEIDVRFAPVATETDAGPEKATLVRCIEVVLKQAPFAAVEKLRKRFVIGVHDGPVTKVENIFVVLRSVLDDKMLEEIRDVCRNDDKEYEYAEVCKFFALSG